MSEWRGPQQAGSVTAYYIEVEDKNGTWELMPTSHVTQGGVPHALFCVGIFEEANLFSYEAAMALAWQYKASVPFSNVRIVPLLMEHSIKTTPNGEPIQLNHRPTA
jgi:hypothetical protein